MSEENSSPLPEPVDEGDAKKAPRVRRISNRNPKKESPKATSAEVIAQAPAEDASDEQRESEAAKRNKRRRRKPKSAERNETSAESSESETSIMETTVPLVSADSTEPPAQEKPRSEEASPRSQHPSPRPPNPPQARRRIDPDLLAKKAWKIFLAEVSEEGVALIGDNDARELTRRCFRLAELFLEEESRRR